MLMTQQKQKKTKLKTTYVTRSTSDAVTAQLYSQPPIHDFCSQNSTLTTATRDTNLICIRWAQCKLSHRAPERTRQATELARYRITLLGGRHQQHLVIYTKNSSSIK